MWGNSFKSHLPHWLKVRETLIILRFPPFFIVKIIGCTFQFARNGFCIGNNYTFVFIIDILNRKEMFTMNRNYYLVTIETLNLEGDYML